MNLEHIAIETRTRSPWAAADLGLAAGRHWWWPMFLSWVMIPAALFALLNIVLTGHPFISLFIVWWLKPFWDRLPLFFISRALFGETLSLRQIYRQALKIFKTDCLAWLLWRRFSPARSFVMPVTVLEQCKGATRGKRISALTSDSAFPPTGCTLILVHLEALLPYAIFVAVWMFIPQWEDFDFFELMDWLSESRSVHWAQCWLSLFIMAAVAPFYVACGFMLYINRRVALEGWDIEIQFRKMVHKRSSHGASPALFLCLFLFAGIGSHRAQAQPVVNNPPSESSAAEPAIAENTPLSIKEQARADMLKIYEGEDFTNIKTVTQWRKKDRAREEPAELPAWLKNWLEKFFKPGEGGKGLNIAVGFFEALLWLAVAILAGILLWKYRHMLNSLGFSLPEKPRKQSTPKVLFGMEVRPESLPDDIPAAVNRLITEHKFIEAMQLLYRASLSRLMNVFHVPFKESDTELECAQQSQAALPQSALPKYFLRLTHVWLAINYAHRPADANIISELAQQWQQHFHRPEVETATGERNG